MKQVLIIDDNRSLAEAFKLSLNAYGFKSLIATSGLEGITLYKKEDVSAVLLDLSMPELDGIETLKLLKQIDSDIPVLVVTGHVDIEKAVEATKLGAYNFVVKPPDWEKLHIILERAIEDLEQKREIKRLNMMVDTSLENVLGRSKSVQRIIKDIPQVSQSNLSVIIEGETGTGKSYLARILHDYSRRSSRKLVKVDVGSLSEELIENELFGHVKGSYTGADREKKGFFETANGGTILLDEIGNMSPRMQSKLLHVIEEREIYPVGSSEPVEVDVRIISATNDDLRKKVDDGTFRNDLFFRLNEFTIHVPALRERIEDIPLLSYQFLQEACDELNKPFCDIAEDALQVLQAYAWPGNIRELKNVMRRSILYCDGGKVAAEHIRLCLCGIHQTNTPDLFSLKEAVKAAEKNAIQQALTATQGNRKKATEILNISYRGLLAKISEYHI